MEQGNTEVVLEPFKLQAWLIIMQKLQLSIVLNCNITVFLFAFWFKFILVWVHKYCKVQYFVLESLNSGTIILVKGFLRCTPAEKTASMNLRNLTNYKIKVAGSSPAAPFHGTNQYHHQLNSHNIMQKH